MVEIINYRRTIHNAWPDGIFRQLNNGSFEQTGLFRIAITLLAFF